MGHNRCSKVNGKTLLQTGMSASAHLNQCLNERSAEKKCHKSNKKQKLAVIVFLFSASVSFFHSPFSFPRATSRLNFHIFLFIRLGYNTTAIPSILMCCPYTAACSARTLLLLIPFQLQIKYPNHKFLH